MSLVKVTEVHQEVPRKATGLALDSTTFTCSAEVGAENLFHAPHLAYAVVNAGEGILSAQIEQSRKLVLYLRPRVLPKSKIVHDGKHLFVCVRGSSRLKDARRRPGMCRLSRRMRSEVGIVIKSAVWMEDTTTGRVRHIRGAAKDIRGVEATERRILGRESEVVGILRVSRQGQRQGDREPRALRLVTLCPGWGRM